IVLSGRRERSLPNYSEGGKVSRSPDRLQVASAFVTMVFAAAAAGALWVFGGPAFGVAVAIVAPLWVVNVALGGGMNQSPLDCCGRVARFRKDPARLLGPH